MSGPSDEQLLRQCQRGDRAALEELVRRYQERIERLADRVLGQASLAEEATASALVKLWAKASTWRGQSAAGTWIYRLALRTILDTRRGQRRWWQRWGAGKLAASGVDGQPAPDELAARHEHEMILRDRLRTALAQLSEEDRAVVHLYYFEQRSLADIEAIVGVSRSALKMRLSRVRQRLRPVLEDLREGS